jgi:hypothetical protein
MENTGNGKFMVTDAAVEAAQAAPAAPATQAESDLVANLRAQIAAQDERLRQLDHGDDGSQSRAQTKKRIRIRIDEARESSEPNPVFVGVNGRGYQIRRGKEVDVPPEVAHVLDIAIAGRGIPLEGGGVEFSEGRRIPYQFIGISVDENGKQLMPKLDYQVAAVPS